jgi:hypothetical protein
MARHWWGRLILAASIIVLTVSVAVASSTSYDDFADNTIHTSRWTTVQMGSGLTIAAANQRLEINIPATAANDPSAGIFGAGLMSTCQIRGDFDLQATYQLLQWPTTNGVRVGLGAGAGRLFVDPTPIVERVSASTNYPDSPGEYYLTDFDDGVWGVTSTHDLTGTLRLVRSGSTVTGYRLAAGTWVVVHAGPMMTGDVRIALAAWSHDNLFAHQAVSLAFDNVVVNQGQLVCPDTLPPTITISTPADGGVYLLRQPATAAYSCTDSQSGVVTCIGSVPAGNPIDTTTAGTKTFTVNAADGAGNAASQTVTYTVAYTVCPLYDQTKAIHSGSTFPIKLQLCDAAGGNVSSSSVVVHVVGLTLLSSSVNEGLADAGNANPDNDFRFDVALGGYIYNLSTKGLTTGTYGLSFTAGGDPTTHTVQFEVR